MSLWSRFALSFLAKKNNVTRTIFTSPNCSGEVKNIVEAISTPKIEIQEKDDVSLISGVPKEQLESRRVKIFVPAKNAMQSGNFKTKQWAMEFDTQERWESNLLGWTSSADPLGQMKLRFSTKEEAVTFCEKNGWKYYVEEKKEIKLRPKAYGDNYSWGKRTRTSHK